MFVLRSSIPLQVSKKVLGIINKQRSAIKHFGGGGGRELEEIKKSTIEWEVFWRSRVT